MAVKELWVPLCITPALFLVFIPFFLKIPILRKCLGIRNWQNFTLFFSALILTIPFSTLKKIYVSSGLVSCAKVSLELSPMHKMLWTCPRSWLDNCCSLVWYDTLTPWTGAPSSPPLLRMPPEREVAVCATPPQGRGNNAWFLQVFCFSLIKALIKKLTQNQKTWGMML